MFQGFSPATIDFMWDIRFYNEKPWFEANRERYQTVLAQPMKELCQDVYAELASVGAELQLQPHVSRIYRDARRTHGKGPYKDHLWFSLRRPTEEESSQPVFWFELSPEDWSYGMGYYAARPLTMAKLRARIDKQPRPLARLTRTLEQQDEFILEGEEYVRPKGDPGPLLRQWYNKKNFSLIHQEKDHQAAFSPELTQRLVAGYKFLIPYYSYFITLDGDPEPK